MRRLPQRPRTDEHPPRVTVLIVEDHDDSREIIRRMAAWCGATVETVTNGRDALRFLARRTPDLILLDLHLPGGTDGYDVMKHVRANPRLRHIPTVALTALCSPADYDRTWIAGFDLHLAKPIDLDLLAGILEDLIGLRSTQRRG
jgi:CheY-like chemotaxis protein